MAIDDDIIRDRRGATRVPFSFPVGLRDTAYAWKGECLNLSSTGALVQITNRMSVGKQLEIELKPGGLVGTVNLKGKVAHTPRIGVLGIQFDLSRSEDFERAFDLFETLLSTNPRLAVEVKRRPTQLSKGTKLYPVPDSSVTPRPEEGRVLTYFLGGRTLGEVERMLGARFKELMYLPFSMLDRGLLSTVKPGSYSEDMDGSMHGARKK